MPALKAFIALENTFAAVMHAKWRAIAEDLIADVMPLINAHRYGDAHALADSLSLAGVVSDNRKRFQELGTSAILFGAHHVTGDLKTTSYMNGEPIPDLLNNAIDQLTISIEQHAADDVRQQLHMLIDMYDKVDTQTPLSKGDDRVRLYVNRPLTNTEDLKRWAKSQGFVSMQEDGDLHVTICYSKRPMDVSQLRPAQDAVVVEGGLRAVKQFGDATVLTFESDDLEQRWAQFRAFGASWDHPGYTPHLTITWKGDLVDLSVVEPYAGPLLFGPEVFAPIKDNWQDDHAEQLLKLERLMKFNPNHDKLGLFTYAGGEGQGGQSDKSTAGTAAQGLQDRGSVSGGAVELATLRRPDLTSPLVGLPTKVSVNGEALQIGPLPRARQAAYDYMKSAGLAYHPPTEYVKVDKDRAAKIANAFDDMKHDPQDPKVHAAYDAMIKETLAQFKAVQKTGLDIDWIDFAKQGNPYAASPRLATEDVRKNNHLWVFPTSSGFGTDEHFDPKDNPLLADTGIVIKGHKLLANDVFRIVHDYFGHIKEGNGFRADGEENAWRSHSAMFSPLARQAMTTETRGQNSWVNYGPYGESNRTADGDHTHFADQKVGLLPEWVMKDGSGQPDDPTRLIKFNHNHDGHGRFAANPGVAMVSPNIDNLDFHGAVDRIGGERHRLVEQLSQEVDDKLGAQTQTHAVVGAWSDGAENSLLTKYKNTPWSTIRTAAAMKASLAEQKAVLVFHQSAKGDTYLYHFHERGDLATIHKGLLKDGIEFHSLVPKDGGADVYVADLGHNMRDTVARHAELNHAKVTAQLGKAEFIGTEKSDGSDAEQRQDAINAYARVIGSSGDHRVAAIWDQLHHAYQEKLSKIRKAFDRFFKADMTLAEQLNNAVLNGGKVAMDIGANLTTSRLVALGFLAQSTNQGFDEYQVNEVLDDKTCNVCRYMHGRTFKVQNEYGRLLTALKTQDPTELKAIAPWPKNTKAGLADLYDMTEAEMQAGGFGSPPYHPGCRGVLSLNGQIKPHHTLNSPTPDDTGDVEDVADGEDKKDQEDDKPASLAAAVEAAITADTAYLKPEEHISWEPTEIDDLKWKQFQVTDPTIQYAVSQAIKDGEYDMASEAIDKFEEGDVAGARELLTNYL